MRRSISLLGLTVLILTLFIQPAHAQGSITVPPKGDQGLNVRSSAPLPGDLQRLKDELSYKSSVDYRILVVDNASGLGLTEYLDEVAAAWGEPGPGTLMIIVFAQENYNIRFFMGQNLTQQGATVDSMLQTFRSRYFPFAHKGDVAGGLARVLTAVSDQYSESMHFAKIDPQVPADIAAAITSSMNRGLTKILSATVPADLRLDAISLDEIKLQQGGADPVYYVSYSVKPAPGAVANWLAGAGTTTADGWVHGKVRLMRVTRTADGDFIFADGIG